MSDIRLESLARRVEALERAIALQATPPRQDWRRVIGMFAASQFMRQVDEEGNKIRETEREQAWREAEAE